MAICERCGDDLAKSLNHLTRRQIAELLAKAVMDEKLPVTILCEWEGMQMVLDDFSANVKEVLLEYHLEKGGTKYKQKEDPKSKRFLRPINDE